MFYDGSTYDYHFIIKKPDNGKTIKYKRFMSSSLSSLVDNLSDGFHCDKSVDCKFYLIW